MSTNFITTLNRINLAVKLMKSHLAVFTLTAILVVSIGITPAFGQIQNSIVVSIDKSFYSEGEVILITGEVRDLFSGTPVSLVVKNDNGDCSS